MNSIQKPPIDHKLTDQTYASKQSIISFTPQPSYTFGNLDYKSQGSGTRKSVEFALNIEPVINSATFNPNTEQHQQLLTGQIHPSVKRAITLINLIYWVTFIMIIVHIYLLLNAIIEYYKIEVQRRPETLAYLNNDLLEIFIFGSVYALISYGVCISAVYNKSCTKLRIFDFLIGILMIFQTGFLVTQFSQYDKIWYAFIICIIINTLLIIISIILDKYLQGKKKRFI